MERQSASSQYRFGTDRHVNMFSAASLLEANKGSCESRLIIFARAGSLPYRVS